MIDGEDRTLQPTEDEPEFDPLNPEVPMSSVEGMGMATDDEDQERLGMYAGDGGDLLVEPASGDTEDPLVAVEEGVPYVPPSDRVLSDVRFDEAGPDLAGTAATDAEELGREEAIQPETGGEPRDGELQMDVVEALRASQIAADEHLRISVDRDTVTVRGEVESVDILDEVLGIVGDVRGVGEVIDEVRVRGI